MYGFNQPDRLSANRYIDYPRGEDPEYVYVFPKETKVLYKTFLWFGEVLQRKKPVRSEETWEVGWRTITNIPPAPEGVHKRLLFFTISETYVR